MKILKKKNALRRTKRFSERRIKRFNELVLKHFDVAETILQTDKSYITRQTKTVKQRSKDMKLFKTKESEIIEAQKALIKGQEELIAMLNDKGKRQDELIEHLEALVDFYQKDNEEQLERIEELEEICERSFGVKFKAEDEEEAEDAEDEEETEEEAKESLLNGKVRCVDCGRCPSFLSTEGVYDFKCGFALNDRGGACNRQTCAQH